VLARYPHVLVIADDHFSLLAVTDYYDVIPPTAQRWALIRSVSKMLGPDLRLAFVASDEQTSQRSRLRLAPGTNWVSHLLQDVVGACLSSPEVSAQIAQPRRNYARRRDILTMALAEQGIAVATPADGLNLWLPLPGNSQAAVLALARHGWLVRGREPFAYRLRRTGCASRFQPSTRQARKRLRACLAVCRARNMASRKAPHATEHPQHIQGNHESAFRGAGIVRGTRCV
jgi:DNA-binding transcriptional MocR family regulator